MIHVILIRLYSFLIFHPFIPLGVVGAQTYNVICYISMYLIFTTLPSGYL